ncbi:MAG TPA: hypothetical protein VGD79_00400 [Thermoanaerobaculia bacterium]
MSTARKEKLDEDIYVPTSEEEAMLEESTAQLERGEWFDWDDVREERRRRQQQS